MVRKTHKRRTVKKSSTKRTHKKRIKRTSTKRKSPRKKSKYHLVIIYRNGVKHEVYVMDDKFHGKSKKKYDHRLLALPPGKRKSAETGRWYYETRARHSDKNSRLRL